MRFPLMRCLRARLRRLRPLAMGLGALIGWLGVPAHAVASDGVSHIVNKLGERIFMKAWNPGEPSRHGGDGLGPVYNEISCLSCHHQGGIGGAGPNRANVRILTADSSVSPLTDSDRETLAKIHPGFRQSASVVVHRFGNPINYPLWREQMLQLDKSTTLVARPYPEAPARLRMVTSSRSTPPLFGLGLIDAIPDAVLEGAAQRRDPKFPEIQGRFSRLPGGRIGRFGWKDQVGTLKDFVLTACAGELGLEVPGHRQSPAPWEPGKAAPGLDLSEGECEALVEYVRSLPAPIERLSPWGAEGPVIENGRRVFHEIGCAVCHVPTLGNVDGLYSDLLLHDMGSSLSGQGSYAGVPASPGSQPARPDEWRTPPLWGLRDSAPYLHDGRAPTVEKAIALHTGTAAGSARRYRNLARDQKEALRRFLMALSAPESERAFTVPAARDKDSPRHAGRPSSGLMSAPAAPARAEP